MIFFLVSGFSANSQNVRNHKYRVGTGMDKTEVTFSDNSIILNYSVSELDAGSLIDQNGKWFRVSIPGHIPATRIGEPEVPVFSRLISLPEGYSYKVRISDVKTSKIRPSLRQIKGDLFPAQEHEAKDQQQQKPPFRIDKDIYSRKEYISSDTVKIEQLGISRGRKLASLSISPVRYNPRKNVIEVITSMKVEIIFSATGSVTAKALIPQSLLFGNDLEKAALSYTPEDLITGYSDKPVRMIILTDTAFRKQLQPFIRWKTQKGIRLDILYKGAAYAGENYADIKNSIASIYNSSTEDNPPPEYLLIVGNVARIPYYGTGNVTDLYYGEFDGEGDYFPEMYIGRLPVADTNELKTVVSKLIQYEKYEFADSNQYHTNALSTAGIDDSHATYMNGQVNYGVSNYLNSSNNINEYHFLYPNVKKDTVIKLINNGLSFINYTGHGSSTGWLYLNITTSDVPALKNKNMYPFIISNACQTSKFNTASFGNSMLLSAQKGAAGYIGCSADSYWEEDYYWAVGVGPVALNPTYQSTGLGALDRLFHTHGESPSDWYVSMGQVTYAGNLAVSGSTSSKKKYYWEIYNLVGDPSIIPIIGTPGTFNIQLPDTLPDNLKSYSFIADPFTYIAVSHSDTLWDASYVSPSGSVTLEMPGLSNDSCLVVVTGQNKIPLIKTIYFSAISKPYINLSGTTVNDSLGNSNGKADYNETIFLKLKIGNLGSSAATNVTASITSTSPYININDGTADLGTLLPGTEKIISNDLKFTISGDIIDKSAVTLDLKVMYGIVEKIYKVDISVSAPKLEIVRYIIDDSKTGNSNFIADPGENINFIFNVVNLGSSNTSGEFSLSSPDPEISILEPSKNSGILMTGTVTEIPLQLKVSSSASEGTTINLNSELNCDPYYASRSFSFRIGRFQETFESASFRVFPWINISPKPWAISQVSPFEGIIAARSGAITDNQSTVLSIKANYTAADSIRFYYKVSSEAGYDHFIMKVNNVEVMKKSGDIPWTRQAVAVPKGLNRIDWLYRKDGSVSAGSDCAYIDLIDFASGTSVKYITRDIVETEIVSPVQSPTLGIEKVSMKLINTGPDTIKGFNLAYSINNGPPVTQHFNDSLIYNGDTVTVTFTTKADFSRFGDYDFCVYSYDNNDDNLLNDTISIRLKNSIRRTVENERSNDKNYILAGPNPFSDLLRVEIVSEAEDTIHISLVSSTGKIMIDKKEFHISQGSNSITLENLMLEPAVYYLVVDFNIYSRTLKVIKLKQ